MSKNKKKKSQMIGSRAVTPKGPETTITSNTPPAEALLDKIDEAVLKAADTLEDSAPPLPTSSRPHSASIDQESLRKMSDYLNDIQHFIREIADVKNKLTAALNKAQDQRTALSKESQSIHESAEQVKAKQKELSEREIELAEKKLALAERESDAKNGFMKQRVIVLDNLRTEIDNLENRRLEFELEFHQLKIASKEKLNGELKSTLEELVIKENELEARRVAYERMEEKINRDRICLDADWQEINNERAAIRKELETGIHLKIEELNQDIERERNKLKRAYQENCELRQEIADLGEFRTALGDRSANQFLSHYSDLKRELREAKQNLELAKESDYATENQLIRAERDGLVEKVRNLETDLSSIHGELQISRIGVLDKERLEQEKRALIKHKQLLSTHLNELESRIDSLTKAQQSDRVFPQLSFMDEDRGFQSGTQCEEVPSLDSFVVELRSRIAGSYSTPLFYEQEDLCLFLGGLAMSQLHIYQGMSGTGKTSLVKAFARAVGGFCADIAVQAGWRDKFDLIGHYSAFEKRFSEEECLQALYRAQMPSYDDRINVVLLDEMNLSHPEQYFAEFLSAIEKNDPQERLIKLLDAPPPVTPRLLKMGRMVLVPENLWFMGTANDDETTSQFADKTQDRSFVMELKESSMFDIRPQEKNIVYSYKSLRKRFKEATKSCGKEVDEIMKELKSPKCDLTKKLDKIFHISFGNRFAEHAKKFIPVVKVASGRFDLGLDHLLATRIFRRGKVTGRYDIKNEDLKEVEKALTTFWASYKFKEPEKCLQLIGEDIRRKERGA